jgi:hypothetical protein
VRCRAARDHVDDALGGTDAAARDDVDDVVAVSSRYRPAGGLVLIVDDAT